MNAKSLIACALFLGVVGLNCFGQEFYESLPAAAKANGKVVNTKGEKGDSRELVSPAEGALSGRIIFTSAGHGWTWGGKKGWYTQRGISHEMNEDYGNLDQMNLFVQYAFNAGATVAAFRPIGYQTNEVILDNTSWRVKFSGDWYKSASPVYFGKAGETPYRFAIVDESETATATYTPKIPAPGFYPVYTWVRHGPDRTRQFYRILHTGGETLVRVPHNMVGNGWVYLGTYYFNAGANRENGSVVISNLRPSPKEAEEKITSVRVVIADAIRFGNGMGDIVPGESGVVSSYPREEEASRYWVLKGLGQGQTNIHATTLEDHQPSNVGAPTRAAREMNREQEGSMYQRIFLGFHSNAGGGRGAIGLWNNPELFPGTMTPNQLKFADWTGVELNKMFCSLGIPALEVPWAKRNSHSYARTDYAFGEINNRTITNEFDATIVEIAFHDNEDDAKLMRDPKVRDISARCCYQAIVRYMHEFDGVPLQFLPEPPRNLRAVASVNGICLAWDPPADHIGGQWYAKSADPASGDILRAEGCDTYLVYSSEDGYGFGNPIQVCANQTSIVLTNIAPGKDRYFRVTAVNAGGESMPSMVVGCRQTSRPEDARVLFVNGFDQFDRFNNPRQNLAATNYVPPSGLGRMERVIPRLNNAFDYVVQHGKALAEIGIAFDSCQKKAIANRVVRLEDYSAVIWAAGRQHTSALTTNEVQLMARYLIGGGRLFVSGSHLAEVLRSEGAAELVEHAPTSFVPAKGSIFRGNRKGTFGDGRGNGYFVTTATRFTPKAGEMTESLTYGSAAGTAALQFDGKAKAGKLVCFGFPFESISSSSLRQDYMADILRFFDMHPGQTILVPEVIRITSGAKISWRSRPGRRYQLQGSADGVLWKNVGEPIRAEGVTISLASKETVGDLRYRVRAD